MLYERSATVLQTLYVCPVENVLGRVPLIPCYLNGNTSNTTPHTYREAIPAEAAADSRQDSGTGSHLFEINTWMWCYGRTFPREIAVTDSVELRKKRLADSRIRAAATMKRRREAHVITRAGNDDWLCKWSRCNELYRTPCRIRCHRRYHTRYRLRYWYTIS